MSVRLGVALAFFALHPAMSQSLAPPGEMPGLRRALAPDETEHHFRCSVEPIYPVLLYSSDNVAAGFTYKIPLASYSNSLPERGWSAVLSLTPDGNDDSAAYLSGQLPTPAAGADIAQGRWTYILGRGSYSARLAISDGKGSVCREQWTVTVAGSQHPEAQPMVAPLADADVDGRTWIQVWEGGLKLATPSGSVRLLSPPSHANGAAPAGRVTVMLHAPASPNAQTAVIDALQNLMDRIPVDSVRLVAFNLEEGREVFRRDTFRVTDVADLEAAFEPLGYRTVSVADLQAHPINTHGELLDSLIQREAREPQASNTVVFLGLSGGIAHRDVRLSAPLPQTAPQFYYLCLLQDPMIHWIRNVSVDDPPGSVRGPFPQPPRGLQTAMLGLPHDSIFAMVDKLKGKTMSAHSTKEFDQAVEKLRKAIHSRPTVDFNRR